MTNFERIKAMSVEEMDEFFPYICAGEWLEWLESDTNENEETVIEKGKYTIAQCSNNHVHIYKDGRMIYHASFNEKLTEKELLDLVSMLEIILDEETEEETNV